jgi:hypothetical protein
MEIFNNKELSSVIAVCNDVALSMAKVYAVPLVPPRPKANN